MHGQQYTPSFFFQGERQILDVLLFTFKQTTSGKKLQKAFPVVEKVGVEPGKVDEECRKLSSPNSAPVLVLFFDSEDKFEIAEVVADDHVLHLSAADVFKAVATYIACYFVFNVGFAPPHAGFLAFLQEVYLDIPYDQKKSVALIKFLGSYNEKKAEVQKLRDFKKFSVNA